MRDCIRNKSITKVGEIPNKGKPTDSIPDRNIFRNEYNAEKLDNSGEAVSKGPLYLKSYFSDFLVNIDTLYLKLSEGDIPKLDIGGGGDEAYCLDTEYTVELLPMGSQQYTRKANIYRQGEKLGKICWGARFPSLEGTAKMEIENIQLYDNLNRQKWLAETIEDLLGLLNSEVTDILRADIAFDSPGLMSFLQAVHLRKITPVRQSALNEGYYDLLTGELKGFSYGSRKSGRFLRMYNKSREMRDKHPDGSKDYIREYWAANGLISGDSTPDVGRLEIELHRKFLRGVGLPVYDDGDQVKDKDGNPVFESVNYSDLFYKDKLVKLAEASLKGWFKWVENESNDSKLNRRQEVKILNFERVKTSGYVRFKPQRNESTRSERIMAKGLIKRAAFAPSEQERQNYLLGASQVVTGKFLYDWLSMKTDSIVKEIFKEAEVKEMDVWEDFLTSDLNELLAEINDEYAVQHIEVKEGRQYWDNKVKAAR